MSRQSGGLYLLAQLLDQVGAFELQTFADHLLQRLHPLVKTRQPVVKVLLQQHARRLLLQDVYSRAGAVVALADDQRADLFACLNQRLAFLEVGVCHCMALGCGRVFDVVWLAAVRWIPCCHFVSRQASRYSPKTARMVSHTSPSVA
jgi:hypothetical protein